jgi:streptogramin lyase
MLIAVSLTAVSVASYGAPSTAAPTSSSYTLSDVVTSLPDVPPPSPFAGVGPVGLVFDSLGHLIVSDAANQGFYSFGPGGSQNPQPLSTGNTQGNLAFAKTGQLFSTEYQAGNLDQIDPASGTIIRQLNAPNTKYQCLLGLATDPISGDLFFSQPNSGGVCPGSTIITRVENPTSPSPTFTTYINLGSASADGLAFGPHGTLYAVVQSGTLGCATRITGTNAPQPPTATSISCVTGPGVFAGLDAMTLSIHPQELPTLYVSSPDGTIRSIDQSTTPPTVTAIVPGGTRTDALAVGTDGCLYATQSTAIERITPANGECSLVPATVRPYLRLRPQAIDSAIVGRVVTLRAQLKGTGHTLAAQIRFTVTGANAGTVVVSTDGSGTARFSYRGIHSGIDTITAAAIVDGTSLGSNPSSVQWSIR